MRASERANLVPGGRSNSAHDRACLYIKERALDFVQRVKPASKGYTLTYTEIERPLYEGGQIKGYIDLMITALDIEADEKRSARLKEWGRFPYEPVPDAFLIDVKPLRESIGQVTRQFKYYKHLWAEEDVRRRFEHLDPNLKALGFDWPDDGWPFQSINWILAPVYKATPDERREFTAMGIQLTELNPQCVK